MSVMVYRKGGMAKLHGFDVDYIIVEADDVGAAKKEGWSLSPTEAWAEAEEKPKRKRRTKAEMQAEE